MGPKTIVSYDDTLNDHDALALGRVLAEAGAELELAYVRHTTQAPARARAGPRSTRPRPCSSARALARRPRRAPSRRRQRLHRRRSRLARPAGAGRDHRVGFDYRTAAGHVSCMLGASADRGRPHRVVIAPANYRSHRDIQRAGSACWRTPSIMRDGDRTGRAPWRERHHQHPRHRPCSSSDRARGLPAALIMAQAEYAIETTICPVPIFAAGTRSLWLADRRRSDARRPRLHGSTGTRRPAPAVRTRSALQR